MDNLKKFVKKTCSDYDRKTLSLSKVAFLITIVFAVYNGFLGLKYSSLWHGSICIYYVLLSLLRGILIAEDQRIIKNKSEKREEINRKVYLASHAILLLLNLSLVVPISLMAKFEKPVGMTLIPAIAMAAYTTFRIVFASIHYKWKEKSENLLVKELRTIDLIDALLSLMTLQNTLIVINNRGINHAMKLLPIVTSAIMLVIIVSISIRSFVCDTNR